MAARKRIVFIGSGAIGRPAIDLLASEGIAGVELAGVLTRSGGNAGQHRHLADFNEVLRLKPDLVVEAAGGEAFRAYAARCLSQGIDFLAVSVAALAERAVEGGVRAAQVGGGRLHIASGAIGALEALTAAREAGLASVAVTQRKPLRAFPDIVVSPDAETVVSSGSAREASLAFPKNANISAAIALAGLGFDGTKVTVVADPFIEANIAEVRAAGDFGEMHFSIRNIPSDLNPSTARLAALSIIAAIRRLTAPLVVPA